MKIAVVGTGYVGLVTGTCFAETGISVVCIDIDQDKIDKLNNGVIPIYEPGLEKLIERNVEKKRLSFSTSLVDNLIECEVIFIAVGTPPDEDGSADLKYVLAVAREIGKHITEYMLIITKSTVPIGTAQKVRNEIQNELDHRQLNIDFDVASNPEFLKEGNAIDDFLKPDRIVVGVDSQRSEKIINRLYKPFLLNGHPLLFMDIPSAELTKYAANSMLATKISFMNDIANLCEILGADVNNVRKGIGSDNRIGNKFIYPGIGYGGSCFPKDVKALIKTANENNYPMEVLKAVEKVNNKQKVVLFSKIYKHYNGQLKGKTFGIWGLSFKPKTDDMREAASIVIIEKLLKEGANIIAYDPVAANEAKRIFGNTIDIVDEQYKAVNNVDGLIVSTEWSEFRVINYNILNEKMKERIIFDGRNIYELHEMKEYGFTYYSIGRSIVK